MRRGRPGRIDSAEPENCSKGQVWNQRDKMRPATSVRIPDKKARNGVSSRWSAKCSGIHASVGFSSVWKWFLVPTLTCVSEQIASAIKDRVALDDTMLLAGPS